MKSISKNSFFNVIYTSLNILFPLITSMYVARVLLAAGAGEVAYAHSIASYFSIAAALGIPIYGIREIAKINETKDQEKADKLFSELVALNAISTLIFLISYIALIVSIPSFNKNLLLLFCSGTIIFFNFFNLDWFYKGKEEYGYIVIRSLTIKVLSLVSVIIFVRSTSDIYIYALITGLAVGGNNVFNFVHSRKYVRFKLKGIKLKPHIYPVIILGISALFERVYGKIDLTMLGIISGDVETGIYSYGHKTIDLALTMSTAITAVFMPRLSYYYYTNSESNFSDLIKKGLGIVSLFVFPLCVGLFIMAPQFTVLLYGEAFYESSKIIRILCPLIIINSFSDLLCYQTLIVVGLEKKRLPAAILGTVINIALNFVLINSLSSRGAAIASVISEIIVNGFLLWFLFGKIKVSIDVKDLLKVLISTAIMGSVVFIVSRLIHSILICSVVCILTGAIIYFSLVFLFKHSQGVAIINTLKNKNKRETQE